jgi:GntR family transcriptional regulator
MNDLLDPRSVSQDKPAPLWLQVKEELERAIKEGLETGVMLPGDRLTGEKELASRFNVSLITVRRALEELSKQGLINRRPGRGTFIAKRKIEHGLTAFMSFFTSMQDKGIQVATQTIKKEMVPFMTSVGKKLRVCEHDPIFRLVRVRMIDGEPILLETVYLPSNRFPDIEEIDFDKVSLYRAMEEEYGVQVYKVSDYLEPIVINSYESELLQVPTGSPALLLERIACDPTGLPIEYSKGVFRGDRCRFSINLTNPDVYRPKED